MATWRQLISKTMRSHGDDWTNVVSMTLTEGDLDRKFDDDYGLFNGQPFTVWTETRVYFPAGYDGAEWCSSVSRQPDGKPTEHVGGGG